MRLQERYRFGRFELDPSERDFSCGEESIPLTGKAFDLLQFLVRDPGRTIPKAELMAAIWPETAVEEGNLTQTVFLLRKALGDDPGHAAYIQTVPRLGYKFVAQVIVVGSATEVSAPVAAHGPRERMRWVLGLVVGVAIVAGTTLLLGRGAASRTKARTLTPFSSAAGENMHPVWSPDGTGVAFAVKPNETDPPQVYVRYLDSSSAMQLTHDQNGGAPIAWITGRIVFESSRAPAGLWTISPASGEAEPLLAIGNPTARYLAHVSGDGLVVAYYDADKNGAYGVMISSPAGSPAKPYSPAPFTTQTLLGVPQVKFSPDGKQIVLLRNAGGGQEAWLMPYPANASNPPRRILRNLQGDLGETVSWMPDNRRIVLGMTSGSEPSQLHMVDTVSGEYSALSTGTARQELPAVSPDGKKLVFQEEKRDRDLFSIDLASSAVRPLLATNSTEGEPAWAAKASVMVYVTDRGGQREIWLHKPGEDDRALVTSRGFPTGNAGQFISPVLSPDGDRVIYARGERTGSGGMWMSAVAGGAPVLVVNPTLVVKDEIHIPGSWSPNGEWIAFLKFLNGKADLYKVRTTGQAQPELLKAAVKRSGSGSVPAWSPTGEWILSEDDGLKLFSPDGKVTRALDPRNAMACGFSRDGSLVYCIRQERKSDPGVFVSVPVAGGPEKVIGPVAPENKPLFGSLSLGLSLAPDGKTFSYTTRKTTANLWIMGGIE
jgi:Tol biopolymer transport system component/DNA-binding winged helix-turn-helix (wHTH) protein